MKSKLIKLIVESGVNEFDPPSRKRGTLFANYISLVLSTSAILLYLIIPQNRNLGGLKEALITVLIFSFPILLNRLSLISLNRFYLCWTPPLLITWTMIGGMREPDFVSASAYSGLRIYLLACSCIPYLLLDRKNVALFIAGVLPSFMILLFCDNILDMAGVGFHTRVGTDPGYEFTQTRSLIAYVVIGGSCLSLRSIVDKTDSVNQNLISELERKNKIIQEHAESELNQLNQQLQANLQKLTDREVVLKRSQDIAKVGSWELNLKDKSVYWSDQMYDIFGVNKDFRLGYTQVMKMLFNESADTIDKTLRDLLAKNGYFDLTLQAKTPIGYLKWIRIIGFPLMHEDETTGVSGIVHDVTFFKESEERIKSNEMNYRSLFEQASDSIMIADLQGNFIDVNSSLCKLLGYTRDEMLQLDIIHVMDRQELAENPISMERLAAGEQEFSERHLVRKDGTSVVVEANVKMFGTGKIMAIARDVTNRIAIEQEKERVRYQLNERIKELTTLYKCSQILQTEKKPVHEVLQELVTILPAGWQFPSVAASRISLGGMEFASENFGPFVHRQVSEFTTRNGLYGTIEIVYLEGCPVLTGDAFLREERDLINMIGDMIRIYLSRRYEIETLKRTEANQSATINNTDFLIWSVNMEHELISYNRPFAEYSKNELNVDVKLGYRLTEQNEHLKDLNQRWTILYDRALAGETFKVGSQRGRPMEYSLNPIIEEDRIIGVSVFGQDISERLEHENEIRKVNKQLGELRLMALRSVMNPHFIFNSLNSIQYYIMANDQLNAVTYLSTFSKLIRSILNNSVKNRVRLADELSMLGHYIQLEALRFENKFDSVIHVDPEIDVESVEIPSMLIQPYVENAILHGLYNKKGKGLLSISISEKNGAVQVDIRDNGVGRKTSSALQQENMNKHKSMGTALTEERLRLINETGGSTVEITDLESDGVAAGTLVRLWIRD